MSAPALLLLVALANGSPLAVADSVYVTWAGAEPDKGASLWYLVRHVTPRARIRVVPNGTLELGEGIPVDTPQADYRRTHQLSTLESILHDHPSSDRTILYLAALMHDIEINLWRPKRFPESLPIEHTVQDIAAGFPDGSIPPACFIAFFDGVHEWLQAKIRTEAPPVPGVCDPTQIEGPHE